MSEMSSDQVKKHVKAYLAVFVALLGLTVVTVTVSYLHLALIAAVVIALIIATIKGSLVASYFMHLISEKKLIYAALILTAIFVVALIFLPLLGLHDHIGLKHVP
jgi:cytochrome c oxidase subunit 4